MDKKSTILLIRHAQSNYNIWEMEAMKKGLEYLDYNYRSDMIDCGLSEEGKLQAKKSSKLVEGEKVKFVFTSPLRRALQTTQLMFKSAKNKPKIIVLPILRERLEAACDVPDNIEDLMVEFPDYDFSLFKNFENKKLWVLETLEEGILKKLSLVDDYKEYAKSGEKKITFSEYLLKRMKAIYPKILESTSNLKRRVEMTKKILQEYQAKLSENEMIAIVSHYSFLHMFTAKTFEKNGAPYDGRYFKNCEVVPYKL